MPAGCVAVQGNYSDALVDGMFFDALYCAFADQLGVALVVLMFVGSFALAQYIYYDSAIPLVVTLMLVGSVFVMQLPAGVMQFVGIALMILIPGVLWLVVQRRLERYA